MPGSSAARPVGDKRLLLNVLRCHRSPVTARGWDCASGLVILPQDLPEALHETWVPRGWEPFQAWRLGSDSEVNPVSGHLSGTFASPSLVSSVTWKEKNLSLPSADAEMCDSAGSTDDGLPLDTKCEHKCARYWPPGSLKDRKTSHVTAH